MSVGDVIVLDGLQSRSEINGHLAVVVELGERWRCQLVETGERIRVKPEAALALSKSEGATKSAESSETPASASRPPRKELKSSDFKTLQEALDSVPEEGAIVHVDNDYNELVRINKPVSLIGKNVPGDGKQEERRRRIAGIQVDILNSHKNLVELRNLQLGCAAGWMRGSGLRVYDGSPVVVDCTIGGMVAIRVDSFKVRSCPVLVKNTLEGRLAGIWWDGACWEWLPGKKGERAPLSPSIALENGGIPKFVLETAAANTFSLDLRWVCCVDSGILAVLTGDHVMPLETPGPEEKDRRAIAAQLKNCSWFVHRPTLALMDRPDLVNARAAWEILGAEAENEVRLEVQTRKLYSEAEQIRHWRGVGQLLPEDPNDCPTPPKPSDLKEEELPGSPRIEEMEDPLPVPAPAPAPAPAAPAAAESGYQHIPPPKGSDKRIANKAYPCKKGEKISDS